jgi:hypothetical protein
MGNAHNSEEKLIWISLFQNPAGANPLSDSQALVVFRLTAREIAFFQGSLPRERGFQNRSFETAPDI